VRGAWFGHRRKGPTTNTGGFTVSLSDSTHAERKRARIALRATEVTQSPQSGSRYFRGVVVCPGVVEPVAPGAAAVGVVAGVVAVGTVGVVAVGGVVGGGAEVGSVATAGAVAEVAVLGDAVLSSVSATNATARPAPASTATIASVMIGRRQFGVGARRVRAAAPHSRHQSWSGAIAA
jgi:hypothetical protein